MDLLTSLSEERPANPSPSQASVEGWVMAVATSPLNMRDWLIDVSPAGSSGKMSPASCRVTEDGILEPLSARWLTSGMASHGECLTLSISEFPNGADVCSLSDILEIGDVPLRFFLSAKACAGILRRAVKRGKMLPEPLAVALLTVFLREWMAGAGDHPDPLEPGMMVIEGRWSELQASPDPLWQAALEFQSNNAGEEEE